MSNISPKKYRYSTFVAEGGDALKTQLNSTADDGWEYLDFTVFLDEARQIPVYTVILRKEKE